MRSAYLGAEVIPGRARELLTYAAAELRRLHDLHLDEPVDLGLAREIELALADADEQVPAVEQAPATRPNLFARFLRRLGVR